jgi:maltodextrin utilization protein YvdJ
MMYLYLLVVWVTMTSRRLVLHPLLLFLMYLLSQKRSVVVAISAFRNAPILILNNLLLPWIPPSAAESHLSLLDLYHRPDFPVLQAVGLRLEFA